MSLFDITKVKAEAEKEVNEEKVTAAKEQLKDKMKEIEDAKKIVRNLERELADLMLEITG